MSVLLTEKDVFPWAERVLKGRITASTRQGGRESGGRPGWFVELEGANGGARYYIRGDRGGDFGFIHEYGLAREVRLLKLLREEGIPVPEVIASSAEPNAAILGFVEGVNDFTLIESAAERDAVARDFARIMARWHAIPAEKFAEIGLCVPVNAEQLVGQDLAVWERGHFPLISEPVPLVTFACQWLRRNLPAMPEKLVLVQGDTGPGQFLFRDGRVQAVVDWELGALGDPMRELAHIRTRDVWYPTGNLPDWFRYYSEFSGTALDEDKIRYYSVIGMLTTALALAPVVQKLNPRDEHAEWLAQDVWSKCATTEAIAKARGVGVARVLGTYGGPGEGTVFDVIQSTENNLGELFAAGMTRVVDAEGNEVSTFVPGGEGISALGSAVGTKGFDVSADGPEVAGLDKKERKISLKSSGADVDGDADKKAVTATIRNRMGALQSCYEKALRGNTGLSGKIVYTITVSVMGTVTNVQVLDDSLQDEGVKNCTVAKIKGWRFPITPGAEASSDATFSVVFSGQ